MSLPRKKKNLKGISQFIYLHFLCNARSKSTHRCSYKTKSFEREQSIAQIENTDV